FYISPYIPTSGISLSLFFLYPHPYPPTALTDETPINTNEIVKIKIDIIFCIVHHPFNLLFPGWIDLYANNIHHVKYPIYNITYRLCTLQILIYNIIAPIKPKINKGMLKCKNVGTHVSHMWLCLPSAFNP